MSWLAEAIAARTARAAPALVAGGRAWGAPLLGLAGARRATIGGGQRLGRAAGGVWEEEVIRLADLDGRALAGSLLVGLAGGGCRPELLPRAPDLWLGPAPPPGFEAADVAASGLWVRSDARLTLAPAAEARAWIATLAGPAIAWIAERDDAGHGAGLRLAPDDWLEPAPGTQGRTIGGPDGAPIPWRPGQRLRLPGLGTDPVRARLSLAGPGPPGLRLDPPGRAEARPGPRGWLVEIEAAPAGVGEGVTLALAGPAVRIEGIVLALAPVLAPAPGSDRSELWEPWSEAPWPVPS